MKKAIGLAIAFVLAAGVIGVGTFAYFADTESSSANQFTAGTLDLKTDDADGVSQTMYATSMAPGDTEGPYTIVLKNSGSLDGSTLDIAFSYVESDGSSNSVDKNPDDTAAMMQVTTLTYGIDDLLTGVDDDEHNDNGYIDIYDLADSDLSSLTGISTSAPKDFIIAVQLRSDTGNDFQGDGITLTMTFTLNQ